MRAVATLLCAALMGCTAADQPPSEAPPPTLTALTEDEVARIARAAAFEVLAAEADAKRKADQGDQPAEIAKANRVQEAATEAESILAAKSRRENGYRLLTASERQRVDAIRETLNTGGLAAFSERHPDLMWGWYGEGRDALEADLLKAVETPPPAWLEATELFGLEGARLLDFWCDDLLETLGRLALAQELRSGAAVTEEMIRLGRVDPLVRPLLIERLKNE